MTDATNPQPDGGPVFRLIYNSHNLIEPTSTTDELGAIFTTARRRNRSLGVTGALIVTGDAFVQALEGDEAVVRDLYAQISRDERHDRVTTVDEQTVPARTFGRWAMARVSQDGGPDIRLLSNATRGRIVEAGADSHVTPEQEDVLGFMRDSVAAGA
jgi:hypothetical protein